MTMWQQQSALLDAAESIKDLQARMEKSKKARGQLLLELGQQQYRQLMQQGRSEEVAQIMEQDVLIYEASRRIRDMQEALKPHRCTSCDTPLEKDAKFCGSCGTPVPQPDVRPKQACNACGSPQPLDASYCACCGGKMEVTA
ncbi:zinc ribbon domain-containing protein [Exiguobacterium marinum]|uniref:Zinc ribbon domain-containing protein n=1 Tax=Exiguobacterium marinum TaxID=273528 RepID=A0ABY7WZL0_9BACL|nr:zinc ribbon domain-containing protein [Exiguobacterium marinum]WDH75314.1 zinc ribbon domain-containing protein [Exiguobacterium marinum]